MCFPRVHTWPLSFPIYINDLLVALKLCKAILFADDSSISTSDSKLPSVQYKAKTEMLSIHGYVQTTITECCKDILYGILKRSAKKWKFKWEKISVLNVTNQGGLHIDEKVTWNDHISYVQIKLVASLYALKQTKCHLSVLIMLYCTLIYPYLSYGIVLWGSTCNSYLKWNVVLQNMQKTSTRYNYKFS